MDYSLINEIVAEANSNEELAQLLVAVKAKIKERKAEIKAKKTAEVMAMLEGQDGVEVTVKAPASFGAPALVGTIVRLGPKSFTVETTQIATATGKPKKLSRTYDSFLGFGDVTADYVAVETDEADADEEAV